MGGSADSVQDYIEEGTDEMQTRLIDAFASLTVVFRKPEQRWMSAPALAARHRVADPAVARLPLSALDAPPPSSRAPPPNPTPQPASVAGGHHQPGAQPTAAAAVTHVTHGHHALASKLDLDPGLELTPDRFQQLWAEVAHGDSLQLPLRALPDAAMVEAAFIGTGVKIIAHGSPSPHVHKFFVYGSAAGRAPVVCETIFDAQQSAVVSTLKCLDPELIPQFADHLRVTLSPFMPRP
jgi:hypothetical protein